MSRASTTEPITEDQPNPSATQGRLWHLARHDNGGIGLIYGSADLLEGQLDLAAFGAALGVVAARHEVLRWRFPERDGQPTVVVGPTGPVSVPVSGLNAAGQTVSAAVVAALEADRRRRIDLTTEPPWRARLLRLRPDRHVLILAVHGIACDGSSFATIRRDVGMAYTLALAGTQDLPAPEVDHEERGAAADLDWWCTRLTATGGILDLPRDRARPPAWTGPWAAGHTALPNSMAAALERLAADLGTDIETVILAAFAILLTRLTGEPCPVVGVTLVDHHGSGRVGCMDDLLPVPLPTTDTASFAAHVRAASAAVTDAAAHGVVPFERLVDALRLPRETSRHPLVQVRFIADPMPWTGLRLHGIDAMPLSAWLPGAPFDLTLTVGHRPGRLSVDTLHSTDLYRSARIDALRASLIALLTVFVERPDQPVSTGSARPVGPALPELLLDPAVPLPGPQVTTTGVVERVRQWAQRSPDAVAATGDDGTLTHAELDRLRVSVTAAVRATGAAPGTPVAVLGSRSVTLPAVLLGVLASGARWLLLDPADTSARPARQVATAEARVIVVCPGAAVPASLTDLTAVHVADVQALPIADDQADVIVAPELRGYLMSTSGTTGEPALIATGEGPLAHFLGWYPDRFGLGAGDATALLAGLAHDVLLRDCLATVAVGGRVCVPPQPLLRDPDALVAWLAAMEVTVLHLTPQLARLLRRTAGSLPRLRLVVSAGDNLTDADLRALRSIAPDADLVNAYGTTETPQIHAYAIAPASTSDSSGSQPVPVGAGVPGSQLVVVGLGGQPAAVGELGEVLIRSRHLATGYLVTTARPDRFGSNPFTTDPGDRVYRTGDMGRYDGDGAVVLAGRVDDQVKVRGHRVEPAEVRAVLCEHPDIADAAVVGRPDSTGETGLAGYAVPRRAGVSARELRNFLATRLPEHARPAALVLVPELPLTAGGKLDRARLPLPVADPASGSGHATPATSSERLVAAVWRDVLAVPSVGVTANFFDIGGHSLSILAVHSQLVRQTGPRLHLVDLFRYPTVRTLAAHLDGVLPTSALERAARRVAARGRAHNRPSRENTR